MNRRGDSSMDSVTSLFGDGRWISWLRHTDGRDHLGDYLRHLSIANGSLMELETQVLIAGRRGYVKKEEEERILTEASEIGKMLSGLTRALKKRTLRRPDT